MEKKSRPHNKEKATPMSLDDLGAEIHKCLLRDRRKCQRLLDSIAKSASSDCQALLAEGHNSDLQTLLKMMARSRDVVRSRALNHNYVCDQRLPFHDSFEEIKSIHNTIISIMTSINNYIEQQKYEIEDDDVRVSKGVSIDTLVFEKRRFNQILLNENKLFESIRKKFYEYQKKIMKRIMLKLKLLYFQIDTDIQFESFNYTPRQSITANIDSKFKQIAKQEDFESILLQEFTPKQQIVVSNSVFSSIKMYIFKFLSKFCVF